jgi:RecB family exonuclease
MTTYLACPAKYRWTYIDPRGKWYLRSKSHYSFGTSLHSVLQRFHDAEDQGVTTTHEAVAALEEGWVEAGYESQDHMLQALAEGKELVAAYVDRAIAQPAGAKTIYVERTFSIDRGSWRLLGRVDRVDEHDDGSLEVIDYKSGRMEVRPDDVADDLAMGVYQILLRARHPGQAVRATIIALRTGSQASASLSDDEAEALQADLDLLAAEILNRDWDDVEPIPKPLCAACDFLPLCRKHPGFELSPPE